MLTVESSSSILVTRTYRLVFTEVPVLASQSLFNPGFPLPAFIIDPLSVFVSIRNPDIRTA